jgi:hypothetical protein
MKDAVASLPGDIKVVLAKRVFCDMDTRIACGLIWKLRVPDRLRATLMSIPLPRCILKDETQEVWRVSTTRHEMTMRAVPSPFYDYVHVYNFVREKRLLATWESHPWYPNSAHLPQVFYPDTPSVNNWLWSIE